jgi:membrane-bound metal-dependent hydrolase YbcI (DUF457 family)
VSRWDARRRVRVYSDPLQHVAIAAAVVAPLARLDRRVLGTAAAAALLIDIDHAVAARSLRVRHTTGLDRRPVTHSLVTCAAAAGLVGAAAGPVHAWATFAALASHLLHDAGDRAAPTPVLWPLRPAAQLGRRWQVAGTLLLTMGSAAAARAAPRAAASPGGDGA